MVQVHEVDHVPAHEPVEHVAERTRERERVAHVLELRRALPLAQLGMRFRFDASDLALLLCAALPLCPLAASIELYLSTFARSFKEAQTYMGLLLLVPMLPGVLSLVRPFSAEAWMYPLPFVGHHALLNAALGGQAPSILGLLVSAAASLVLSALLVAQAARLLTRESIVFGR